MDQWPNTRQMPRCIVLVLSLAVSTSAVSQPLPNLSPEDSLVLDSHFETWSLAPSDTAYPSIKLADFNGDGHTDKLVALDHGEFNWPEAEPWRRYAAILGGDKPVVTQFQAARADCVSIQRRDSTRSFPRTDAIRMEGGVYESATYLWYRDQFVTTWSNPTRQPADIRKLSAEDSAAIDAAYADWSLYPAADCVTVYFSGDFNGDGWRDKVIALGDPGRHLVESLQEVVVVFGGEPPWAYPFGRHLLECLGLSPKGRMQTVVHTDIAWQFETDGIYSCYPEKAGSDFIWYGGVFHEIGTSD